MASTLEEIIVNEGKKLSAKANVKEKIVDTGSALSYSLVMGSALDWLSGLRFPAIILSRSSAAAADSLTGALYGMWRDWIFKRTKTTEKSSKIKKYLTDLAVFDGFQIPVYATVVSLTSYLTEGYVDWAKVKHGVANLATISPFIGPLRGWYMDKARKLFRIESAPEKADEKAKAERERRNDWANLAMSNLADYTKNSKSEITRSYKLGLIDGAAGVYKADKNAAYYEIYKSAFKYMTEIPPEDRRGVLIKVLPPFTKAELREDKIKLRRINRTLKNSVKDSIEKYTEQLKILPYDEAADKLRYYRRMAGLALKGENEKESFAGLMEIVGKDYYYGDIDEIPKGLINVCKEAYDFAIRFSKEEKDSVRTCTFYFLNKKDLGYLKEELDFLNKTSAETRLAYQERKQLTLKNRQDY